MSVSRHYINTTHQILCQPVNNGAISKLTTTHIQPISTTNIVSKDVISSLSSSHHSEHDSNITQPYYSVSKTAGWPVAPLGQVIPSVCPAYNALLLPSSVLRLSSFVSRRRPSVGPSQSVLGLSCRHRLSANWTTVRVGRPLMPLGR